MIKDQSLCDINPNFCNSYPLITQATRFIGRKRPMSNNS